MADSFITIERMRFPHLGLLTEGMNILTDVLSWYVPPPSDWPSVDQSLSVSFPEEVVLSRHMLVTRVHRRVLLFVAPLLDTSC